MKQDKNLRDIELQTEFILAHVRRIRKSGNKLHPLDRDMLLNKTRVIYEKLLETDKEEPDEVAEKAIELPETMPEAGIPETAESTKNFGRGELVPETPPVVHKQEIPAEEKVTEETPEQEPAKPEEPEKQREPDQPVRAKQPEEKQEIAEEPVTTPEPEDPPVAEEKTEEEKEETASTPSLDLFSTAEETIAEKLAQKDESTVADKISRNVVNDLRQVIGINEKFLFINELFNGDMTRYNKVIDDLNSMQNSEGAGRYLIELKVAAQWPDDMEAFIKLKELVERKFT